MSVGMPCVSSECCYIVTLVIGTLIAWIAQ